VFDLTSPKPTAVELARRGVEVSAVDAFDQEIATWRSLSPGRSGASFTVADGRSLPFPGASIDHAYSISVPEHIADGGGAEALLELARVVRPGRVVVTGPHAESNFEDWRNSPVYGDQVARDGRYFLECWYDRARLDELARSASGLRLFGSRILRLALNWHRVFLRGFPWSIALGPFYGLLATEREAPPGDAARLTLKRVGS